MLTAVTGILFVCLFYSVATTTVEGQGKTKTKTVGGIEFVYIPGGTFMMGSPDGVGKSDEHPLHKVKVSSFWFGKYEVTQKQYDIIIGSNQSRFMGDNLPVESVSWNNAKDFCSKFTLKYGDEVRLPTEAEWEYACRAGSNTKYYWGDNFNEKYCWYKNNSSDQTHPVGQKLPNAWGLFDMSGNVWEWCEDWGGGYSSTAQVNPKGPSDVSLHVFRGGSWYTNEDEVRSAVRLFVLAPDSFDSSVGFRLVMEEK